MAAGYLAKQPDSLSFDLVAANGSEDGLANILEIFTYVFSIEWPHVQFGSLDTLKFDVSISATDRGRMEEVFPALQPAELIGRFIEVANLAQQFAFQFEDLIGTNHERSRMASRYSSRLGSCEIHGDLGCRRLDRNCILLQSCFIQIGWIKLESYASVAQHLLSGFAA
jgi:hypothetical protein